MPLTQPAGRRPRYYMSVGPATNLHSPAAIINDTRLPFATHDPMLADGDLALNRLEEQVGVPHPTRRMAPEKPPKSTFSFSGKPTSHRLYYSGR
jgi:hypothetical protein